MTLPAVQPLCGDRPVLRPHAGRRKACLSAAWADQSASIGRKERRRAIYSWTAGGYGALQELDESAATTIDTVAARDREGEIVKIHKKGKVADHTALLDACTWGRSSSSGSSARQPVPIHANVAAPGDHASSRPPTNRTSGREPLSSIRSLLGRSRKAGGGGESEASAMPLVQHNGAEPVVVKAAPIRSATSLASLRKCETVLTLAGVLRSSSSSSSIEPLQPVNRLRISPTTDPSSRMCSRCSSLLTLASSSRYSLNSSTGCFAPVPPDLPPVLCKLCLAEVPPVGVVRIAQCDCAFCEECMKAYVEFEIAEGAYDISCPDAQCSSQGILQQEEIKRLAGCELLEKHKKYRLNREIELDKSRTWCPRAGCETVCSLCPSRRCAPQSVYCPTCSTDFCSNCKLEWHQGMSCEQFGKQLAREGKVEDVGIPFDSDLIKCCPMCNVPIEKDEGCAQMMCKRCKHVFCWYCLASLDDDFLLRHYDKGPCKNKLGHSRASVIWHRTQVIGIFAGFGILLLVASPLLLLAAPCIVCCKCRICNAGTTKLDNEDDMPTDES